MIDLTKKGLPNVVEIGGNPYSIYTDFRKWMKFEISVSKMQPRENIDVSYLFKGHMPTYCNLSDLYVFSRPMSPLPRQIGAGSDAIVIDYELDAELIYAAFLGQYGIDLTEVEELHWHKFLALLKGLNESTRLREVMGYRCYEKRDKDSNVDVYEQLRLAWEIERIAPVQQEDIDRFNNYFD